MEEALKKFNEVINNTSKQGTHYDLHKAGWVEQCPTEPTWKFRHPDYPRVEVHWTPLQTARAVKV